jgi:pimeloyl-ACP methyl ester carboxylesterase
MFSVISYMLPGTGNAPAHLRRVTQLHPVRSMRVIKLNFALKWRILLFAGLAGLKASQAAADESQTSSSLVKVDGVELHCVVRGNGPPLVFIHGALDDYRMWEAEIEAFGRYYRAVAYSRRYNFPNHNSAPVADYSAIVDAEDVAGMIQSLKLGPVHLVAHSYGGYAALFLATRHPELVRSLVLAEPAVLKWAADRPAGRPLFESFMKMWQPVREALQSGRDTQALEMTLEYFEGKGAFQRLPSSTQQVLRDNLEEWRALARSANIFPPLPREQVARVQVPTLLLTGARTLPIHQFIDAELQSLLPHASSVTIPQAGHEMWADNAEGCRDATLKFLRKIDSQALSSLPDSR